MNEGQLSALPFTPAYDRGWRANARPLPALAATQKNDQAPFEPNAKTLVVASIGREAMIERVFDEDAGIIRVTVSGAWDSAEIDDHYAELQTLIATLRGRSIPIRILVDIRNAPKRPPAVEAQIASKKDSTYRPGDRVAILTSDSADKEHVRALFDGISKWGWESGLAAEQWLLLPDDLAEASQ